VLYSSRVSHAIAWLRLAPHISGDGRSELQTAGRDGCPNSLQRRCASSCTQGTPAGLPPAPGWPGMVEVIDGALQHAPQCGRQSIE